MERITEDQFIYQGYRGCDSICRLDMLRNGDQAVVMLTELSDNPGTSITNIYKGIATEIVLNMGLDPHKTNWIEHYPKRTYGREMLDETFDQVTLQWNDKQQKYDRVEWRRMKDEDVPIDFKGIVL